jgi:Cytochrome c3
MSRNRTALIVEVAVIALVLAFATRAFAQQAKNLCLDCHSAMDGNLQIIAQDYSSDIHAQKGLSCASCHGGDPSSDENAMNAKAGFRGHIDRKQIPQLCGSCHSDVAKMRQYNASLRTDQFAQYKTSVHGKKLAGGDTHVAVCIDCHGVHGIRPANDPRSSVHPLKVAETCKRCHADREHMKPYGIPTDQFAGYTASVHYKAQVERGDLSAPTCTTCHGNHGAAPPGVASVANVCSTCHVFQAQLFEASPHKQVFAGAGLPGCMTCHSNHRINAPTDEMIGGGSSVCANCHSQGDAGFAVSQSIHMKFEQMKASIARSDTLLKRAASAGMEVRDAETDLTSANDALMKARVAVHAVTVDKVSKELDSGEKNAAKAYSAGMKALQERDYRRRGLALSVLAILFAMTGLAMYIRVVEKST